MRKPILIRDENGNESTWAIQRWWIYRMEPLDYWAGWTKIRRNDRELKKALNALRKSGAGWEGDIVVAPYRVLLPVPDRYSWGFAWIAVYGIHQDNNGTCFFMSTVEMPWFSALENVDVYRVTTE